MIVLHLGVSDIPYANGGKTTGDVAEILEEKYHIVEHFWQAHQGEIVAAMKDAIEGSLESVMMGAPPPNDPNASATTQIEKMFNVFLDTREMDHMGIPGVPTAAALRGVNHRMKHPYKRRAARASFIDTGAYEGSFRAWVDSNSG